MRIHIVAVSGTGMGALAGLLSALGHEVSGSDVAFDPPIGPKLEGWGVRCLRGFSAEHLNPEPDLVVIGNLCRKDNPEARYAIDNGLDYTHIAGALQRFVLPGTRPLVVAGTHGKTTTSALAAALLEGTGQRPGYLIGGVPRGKDRSFQPPDRSARSLNSGKLMVPFVIEGDEYDTAFFEKTAKFLHYRAEVAILTSIEHDHIDIYPTLADYRKPFAEFISRIPVEGGVIVANAADVEVRALCARHARAQVVWYALQGEATGDVTPAWWVAPSAEDESGTSFDLFAGGVATGRWVTPLAGRYNLGNVAAAVAAVAHGYGIEPRSLREPVARFAGVKRRQELLGTPAGVLVYDDFAHHPTAVHVTLEALKARHPRGRLWAVFEPRSATACRKLHQDAYPASFEFADEVLLAPVARALPDADRLDVGQIALELKRQGKSAEAPETLGEIEARLLERAQPGDVIALLSNGSFGGIHARLLDALAARASSPAQAPGA
jgi:UDP-N-acetylmuramate: L-alanyl-gamma-D-glutamyl-meso-diaminopimelate ligase